jgi:hypothetical protein
MFEPLFGGHDTKKIRGTRQDPDLDSFAAAAVAWDLDLVKQLFGGHDTKKIRLDVERLPPGLPRWSSKVVSLLETRRRWAGRCCGTCLSSTR